MQHPKCCECVYHHASGMCCMERVALERLGGMPACTEFFRRQQETKDVDAVCPAEVAKLYPETDIYHTCSQAFAKADCCSHDLTVNGLYAILRAWETIRTLSLTQELVIIDVDA